MNTAANSASYDLHLHSRWSYDATAPVGYYFRRAHELNLRRIAVADHYTMDALPDILRVAERYPDVRFIPAVELTVRCGPRGYDMLFYGCPAPVPPEVEAIFEKYRAWQCQRGIAVCRGMQAIGCDYTDEQRVQLLHRYRPQETMERQGYTHVQNSVQRNYFIERGFIARPEEYAEILKRAAIAVPPPPLPSAEETVPTMKRAGAVATIAHPKAYFKGNDRQTMDALREQLGFDGIECSNGENHVPPELVAYYRDYCREHGLFSTAGSDCHADAFDNPHGLAEGFAQHLGEDSWLDEFLERLPHS